MMIGAGQKRRAREEDVQVSIHVGEVRRDRQESLTRICRPWLSYTERDVSMRDSETENTY